MSDEQPIQEQNGAISYSCIKCKVPHAYNTEICPHCQFLVPEDIIKSRESAVRVIQENNLEAAKRFSSHAQKFLRGGQIAGFICGIFNIIDMWMQEPTRIVFVSGLANVQTNPWYVHETSKKIGYGIVILAIWIVIGVFVSTRLFLWLSKKRILK